MHPYRTVAGVTRPMAAAASPAPAGSHMSHAVVVADLRKSYGPVRRYAG